LSTSASWHIRVTPPTAHDILLPQPVREGFGVALILLPHDEIEEIGVVIYGSARNVKGLLNDTRIGTDAVIYPALSERHLVAFGP
jgi:hypothetical protein